MAAQDLDQTLPAIAQAMINTSQLPLLLMDGQLRVVAASRSFCAQFQVSGGVTNGCALSEVGTGEWSLPQLRSLLELALNDGAGFEGYQMDLVRPNMMTRQLLLNAEKVAFGGEQGNRVLLTIQDITDARLAETIRTRAMREKDDLLNERRILLEEVQHRIANSLQIIASILMLKARAVQSDESRKHLEDAHHRVLSIAAIQTHLSVGLEAVEIRPYLIKLCASLSASMIQQSRPIKLLADVDDCTINPRAAVSLGLVVTELVINALKHAFPDNRAGKIVVAYRQDSIGWALSVEDNGAGLPSETKTNKGLGSTLVAALAGQLEAEVFKTACNPGVRVSVMSAGCSHSDSAH